MHVDDIVSGTWLVRESLQLLSATVLSYRSQTIAQHNSTLLRRSYYAEAVCCNSILWLREWTYLITTAYLVAHYDHIYCKLTAQ
jgi:hypothetical protein